MIESSAVISEIRSLLETPADDPPARHLVEHTLTNGYACALRLEGEKLRIEHRLRSVVRGEAGGELGELTIELSDADQELAHLRRLLSTLKAHALA